MRIAVEAAARTAALDAADATGPPVTPRDATPTDAAAAARQVTGPEALLVTTRNLSQWASSAGSSAAFRCSCCGEGAPGPTDVYFQACL